MSTVARTTENAIPPLTDGERLTRAEFERRYDAMPDARAELIEGVVHMASPVRHPQHARPHLRLSGWLMLYIASTPGVDGGDNGTVRLDDANEYQPDAYLFIAAEGRGRARLSDDHYVEGPPELVAEIAASTADADLGAKREAYRRGGVSEYLVWRVLDRAIDWFVLREGRYQAMPPDADGLLKSRAFPGLWLDASAMIGDDLPQAVAALNRGLASPEHAAFVERLKNRTP